MRSSWSARLLLVAWCVCCPSSGLEMVLTHVGDMHSRFDETDGRGNECAGTGGRRYGGIARMATAVAAQRKEAAARGLPSLFVVAGDTYTGTAYYTFFKWRPVAEFINALAPNVMTLGNHEFDDGLEGLLPYLKATARHTAVVSANVEMNSDKEAARLVRPSWTVTLTDRTGRTVPVGVVGYVTKNTQFTSNSPSVKFTDEIASLKREVKKLKKKGVKIIIGLGHCGINVDKKVAAEVDGIDLIVGGHSHSFLYSGTPPDTDIPEGPYPTWAKAANGKKIPILHAGAFTKYLGKAHLRFNDNGDLEEINGNPILLDSSVPQDLSVLKIVKKWKSKLNHSKKFVGEITEDLVNDCRTVQCDIGNIIADSFIYYNHLVAEKQKHQWWTDAPIAIVQAGTIRASINVSPHGGKVSTSQLITTIPYTNILFKVTLSGKNLLEGFEHSVRDYDKTQGSKFFLQVSGAMVEYDLSSDPGNRVVSLNLRCGRCRIPEFAPVVSDEHYTVLMSDYLAKGGDQYTSFKNGVFGYKSLHVTTYDATVVYMNVTRPVRSEPKGTRIRFVNRGDV